MIKNNKGFMLVEVIITSTIIITCLVFFYSEFNKLYVKYNEKNNYHDIDTLYATKEIINYLITNDNFDFNNYILNLFNNSNYGYIIQNGEVKLDIDCKESDENCKKVQEMLKKNNNIDNIQEIQKFYNIKNMIITEYYKCGLDETNCAVSLGTSIKSKVSSQSFKDYIEYVINYYNLTTSDENKSYNYIILTELEDNNNTYYSSIRIR